MLTLRHELIENRKALLLGLASIWGIFMLVGALFGLSGSHGGPGEIAFIIFAFMAISCVTASLTFSNMKTKQGRISAIMLPSTAFDKFMVRWIAFVPVLIVVLVSGMYICDLSRILVYWLRDYPQIINGRNGMDIINPWARIVNNPYGEIMAFILAASFLLNQAIYMLGSALWPKLSFFKTLLAQWCLETVLIFIIVIIDSIFDIEFSLDFLNFVNNHGEGILISIGVLEVLITLGVYILAYLRFRKNQVIYKLF